MRYNLKFDFVKLSRYFFGFSILITVLGIVTLLIHGLNYGVDFRAGSSVDFSVSKNLQGQTDEIKSFIGSQNAGHSIVTVGQNRVTVRFDRILSSDQENAVKQGFAAKFDPKASAEVNTVDPEMATELQANALKAILIASLGIIIYVSIRFEWRFAIAAIVALLHDAFIVISLFSIFKWEVDLPFIVAILTIIGYSINDTIVIFDRIRENMRFAKIKTFADLQRIVNESVWETMTRSINTVATVFFAALCLYIFGSVSIKLFSLAMLLGLISGAYSSIFIASPLWLLMKKNQGLKPAAKSPAAT